MSAKHEQPCVSKAATGIPGFDEITGGGLPRGRTTLLLGGAGSGKTVFALQVLVNGARQFDEPAIFVAFEENSRQIIANAASFGWDLPALERDKLFFLDARLSPDTVRSGGFDLTGMLASIEAKAKEMGARRIVFDSLDVMLTLLDNRSAERDEVYRLHEWLQGNGITGIITSGTLGQDSLSAVHYGFMQFMADCVVLLNHRMEERSSVRELRVLKYRGTSFAENEFPMVISDRGIDIASPGEPWMDFQASTERLSSGVPRLDTMLDGGYYRGTSVLITGSPGTAKSTLCAAFAEAACKRGERALYFSFDEAAAEIVRNMASVGIDLAPHVDSGLLCIRAGHSESRSAEEHLLSLKRLIEELEPRCMVVDPLSAMIKAGGHLSAIAVAQRLLAWTKSRAITLVSSSLIEGGQGEMEATDLRVSTIADTWIHLSYLVQGGERNRALTVVKSRGTKHSHQVRELILSDEGVTLADVYTAGGEVLMGTLRWEREQANQAALRQRELELRSKQRQLELAEADTSARIRALQLELEVRRADLATLASESGSEERRRAAGDMELGRLRGADESSNGPTREGATYGR